MNGIDILFPLRKTLRTFYVALVDKESSSWNTRRNPGFFIARLKAVIHLAFNQQTPKGHP
jgi:hypothetical protein